MKRRPQEQIVLLNGNPNFDSSGFNKCFWSLIQNSRRDFNKSGFSSRKVSLVGKRQSRSFCMRLACQRVAGPAPPSLPAWRPARMQAERCRTPLEGFSLAMHAGTANKKKVPEPVSCVRPSEPNMHSAEPELGSAADRGQTYQVFHIYFISSFLLWAIASSAWFMRQCKSSAAAALWTCLSHRFFYSTQYRSIRNGGNIQRFVSLAVWMTSLPVLLRRLCTMTLCAHTHTRHKKFEQKFITVVLYLRSTRKL